jgi:hypothetical protein
MTLATQISADAKVIILAGLAALAGGRDTPAGRPRGASPPALATLWYFYTSLHSIESRRQHATRANRSHR